MKRTVDEGGLTKRQRTSPAFIFDLLAEDGNLFQVVCMHLPFQTFARLARVNTFYRKLIAEYTPAKIEEWLDIHSRETDHDEKVVYLSRANRMYVDNQITQSQFKQLQDTLFPDNPDLCLKIAKKWSPTKWFDFERHSRYELKKLLIRSRPPDEVLLRTNWNVTVECDITLLCGYRPATVAYIFTERGNWTHECEIDDPRDIDVSLFQKSSPDHILMSWFICGTVCMIIYNTVDFALLRTMPYFFKLNKFIIYRNTPYTASMIAELGSPCEYSAALCYGDHFPPFELIEWMHTSSEYIDFHQLMNTCSGQSRKFPCFTKSIHYLMNHHCIDCFVQELNETGKINKSKYKALKDAIESVNKNSV